MRLAALTALMFTTAMTMTACGGGGDDGGGDDELEHPGDDGGDDSSGDDSSGDDSSGDDSSSGGSSCQEIVACFGECETDACVEDCINEGSSDGQNQILDLLNCAAENNCEDSECLSENCGTEINACAAKLGDVAGGSNGLVHELQVRSGRGFGLAVQSL